MCYRIENYESERDCYIRLKEHGIQKIRQFEVPQLFGYEDDCMAIEIGIVKPPYILDFGKAFLDILPLRYREADMKERIAEDGVELFGDRWREVRLAISFLEGIGIYYFDPRPANISFGDEDERDD